jgi:hypothetical protein
MVVVELPLALHETSLEQSWRLDNKHLKFIILLNLQFQLVTDA